MMPRKENGVPGLGGGIWSQKRGSFKMEKAAQRNAARDARLAVNAPGHSALRAGNTPSPAASEGSGALPFAIPLQPTPKAGRSLSHSQGQRDFSHGGGAPFGSNGERESGALPLGLLTEEDPDTETESELGGVLTQTASHPYALQRTSTLPAAAFGSYLGGPGYEDDDGDAAGGALSHGGGDRGNGYGGESPCSFSSLLSLLWLPGAFGLARGLLLLRPALRRASSMVALLVERPPRWMAAPPGRGGGGWTVCSLRRRRRRTSPSPPSAACDLRRRHIARLVPVALSVFSQGVLFALPPSRSACCLRRRAAPQSLCRLFDCLGVFADLLLFLVRRSLAAAIAMAVASRLGRLAQHQRVAAAFAG